MKELPGEEERRVVPRWRSSGRAAALGETTPAELTGALDVTAPEELQDALDDYRRSPDRPGLLTDAISIALVLNQTETAKALATEALAAAPGIRGLPQEILQEIASGGRRASREEGTARVSTDLLHGEIRRLKAVLVVEPRAAIAWTDLALQYATLGQDKQSLAAIERALRLAPESRFVLRSAARLLLHFDKKERALWLLRGASRTRVDPWLLSAEVAVASVLGKTPHFVREARSYAADETFSPRSRSELRAGLGSIELEAGSDRQARRLLREALSDSTENALAQVVWARRRIGAVDVPGTAFCEPSSFEARSLSSFEQGRWKESLEEAMAWQADEPFASRPAGSASFTAGVMLESHDVAIASLTQALRANPKDGLLLNNLAFSLASTDKILEARQVLAKIASSEEDGLDIAVTATTGLAEFRSGNVQQGEALYRQAIELARERNDKLRANLARIFLAQELSHIRPDASRVELKLVSQAAEKMGSLQQLVFGTLTDRVAGLVSRNILNEGRPRE